MFGSDGELDRCVELGVLHADLLHHAVGDVAEVDHLAAQDQAPRLESADVKQLGDQAGDAIGVVMDLLEHHLLLVVAAAGPTG